MLPPPTTIATSTPRSCTRLTVRAIAWIRSASTPYGSGPMQRLARQLQQHAPEGRPTVPPYCVGHGPKSTVRPEPTPRPGSGRTAGSRRSHPSSRRSRRAAARSCGRRSLSALTCFCSSSTTSSSHFRIRPSAIFLRTSGGLLSSACCSKHRQLARALVLGNVVLGHPPRRRRCDVNRDLARELDELLVAGDEVRLAVRPRRARRPGR